MKNYSRGLVLGLGRSGYGAARLLLRTGTRVTVIDRAPRGNVGEYADILRAKGAEVQLDCRRIPPGDFDIAIVSPGVPLDSPWMDHLRQEGVPTLSELELGWRRCRGRVLAITGSNGKSTLVSLCHKALRRSGMRARAAGNGSMPLTLAAEDDPQADVWVLEVSSFQLETVNRFRPDVGVLLNIHPNHLDRHHTLELYRQTKLRLFARTGPADCCIMPRAMAREHRLPAGAKGRLLTFGVESRAEARYRGGGIVEYGGQRADLAGTLFDNDVTGPAAAAGFAALCELGVSPAAVEDAARSLEPLPHRLQAVGSVHGIPFIDDSKATNLASLQAALRRVGGNIRLIAGGQPKERDFTGVIDCLVRRVKRVYLIGEAAPLMMRDWSGAVACIECGVMEKAVELAWEEARSGESILLAPGCASFDQFRDFGDRGDTFRELYKSILKREEQWTGR